MRFVKMLAVIAVLVVSTAVSRAGDAGGGDGFANTQFRRTVDPSPRTTTGSASFRINGDRQTCEVKIKGLGETDFGVFVGESATPDTNSLIETVAPLDRTRIANGSWVRRLKSTNGSAPLEFPVNDLHELSGGILVVGRAGDNKLIQGVTNIVGNVTNVLVGIPIPQPNVTNTVGSVMWAPIPDILLDHAPFSFHARGRYRTPGDPASSPKVRATAVVQFTANTGRSVLDIRAVNLIRGQTYTLFIADSTNIPPAVLIPAGEMTANHIGSTARFRRDTQFGDPLPQQVRDVTELNQRIFEIRDAFGNLHVEGNIP